MSYVTYSMLPHSCVSIYVHSQQRNADYLSTGRFVARPFRSMPPWVTSFFISVLRTTFFFLAADVGADGDL
jgi:hypothetical protein